MSSRHPAPFVRHPRLSLIAHVVAGTLLAPLPVLAQQAPAVSPPVQTAPKQATPAAPSAPSAPAAAPAPAPEAPAGQALPVESTVTVSATRTLNRIDRQSYDVKADPATSNDTVADTLNKVPSVAVDPDGNVTLRGRSNVQILVDGKPSAMMQGENRAAAIAAIPASDLDSVEVINNPGAQFGNEGGGGPIINLVMRRERTPGGFATVNANVGTQGRYNTSAFGSYTTGRMSAQGNISRARRGGGNTSESNRERINPSTGASSRVTQVSNGENRSDALSASGSLSYNVGAKDVAAITASLSENSNDSESFDRYRNTNTAGVVDNDYLRTNLREGRNRNYSLGGRYDHKGDEPGELFKLDLRLSASDGESDTRSTSDWTVRPPSARVAGNRQDNENETRILDFTGDYELPGEHGVFKSGYKVARNKSVFDNAYFDVDPATFGERPNASRTNRFELTDTTLALYGSFQWRVNEKWGVLGGLRAEYADLDMNQVTTNIHATNHYFDAIPSAFVTYGLSDDTTLRLSYARRIRRPGSNDLNPFVVYRDELNVSSGNPNLEPSTSDSLELGIETKLGKVDTNVRLYVRHDADLINERRFFIANDVLLTTRENAGSSRSGGLEFNFSGRPTPQLNIGVSGNIGYSEQTVLGSVNNGTRSATSITGRGRIGYQINPTNHVQVTLDAQGKTLFGEGYREPTRMAHFNYRRNLTPALTLLVNVNDVFDSQKMESITETDILREYSLRRFGGRMAYIGLSYRFGGFTGPGGQRRQMNFGGPGGGGRGPGGGGGGPGGPGGPGG